MNYKPCRYCKIKDDCEHLQTIKEIIKGMFATSLTIQCDMFEPLFNVGERVQITLLEETGNTIYVDEMPEKEFLDIDHEGTIIGRVGSKFRIFLDDREGHKTCVVKIFHKHIQKLDEPDIELCILCGTPANMKRSPSFDCKCEVGKPILEVPVMEYGKYDGDDDDLPF